MAGSTGRGRVRRGRRLAGGVVAALVFVGMAVTDVSAGGGVTQQVPQTAWNFGSLSGLDLVGSWAAMVNDPVAGPGQAAPSWSYTHLFGFGGTSAHGVISLDKEGSDKFATLTLVDPGGVGTVTERIPYPWEIERFYFPFVIELPGGVVGGWVYDNTADDFTFIGVITHPKAWGQLHPLSVTRTLWSGSPLASCDMYPRSEHFRHPPIGTTGGTVHQADLIGDQVGAGDCTASISSVITPWKLYIAGTGAAATTTTSTSTSTTIAQT